MQFIRFADGIGGFTHCQKCGILYQKDKINPCSSGGNHESILDSVINSFVLPYRDPFAIGKPFLECTKCGGIYSMQDNAENNSCIAREKHESRKNVTYTIATSKQETRIRSKNQRDLNTNFKQCVHCGCIYNTKGNSRCSKGDKHQEIEGLTIYLIQFTDYSSWQKVFNSISTINPFPTFDTPSLKLAYAKFNDNEKFNKNLDLRDYYREVGPIQISKINLKLDEVYYNGPPFGVSQNDWDLVYQQLTKEVDVLGSLMDYFNGYNEIITEVFMQENWVIEQIRALFDKEQIIELEDGLGFLDIFFCAFGFVFNLVLEDVGEELEDTIKELIKGALELSEEAIKVGLEGEHTSDWDIRYALSDTAEKIYVQLEEKFGQLQDSIIKNRDFIISDWQRMQEANKLIGSWNDVVYRNQIKEAWISGYKISLFQTLFPARFAIFHAQATDIKGFRKGYDYRNFIKHSILTEKRGYAIQYLSHGPNGGDLTRYDSLTAIMKREFADVGLAITFLQGIHGANGHKDIFPSEEFMNKLTSTYNNQSINLDALFNNYGGWEGTPRFDKTLIWLTSLNDSGLGALT